MARQHRLNPPLLPAPHTNSSRPDRHRRSVAAGRHRNAGCCAVTELERRCLLSGGGGFTDSGLHGDYFNNNALSGAASFSRQDVRVDFDWGTRAPGGSIAPPYTVVNPDNFSVRWTGQFVPEATEPYTFYVPNDDGVRLSYRRAGDPTFIALINDWSTTVRTGSAPVSNAVTLTAGQKYDILLEYHDLGGVDAKVQLLWSTPNVTKQVIDPVRTLSVGLTGLDWRGMVDKPFADVWKTIEPYEYSGRTFAGEVWPVADFHVLLWDRDSQPGSQRGTYTLTFDGKADVHLDGATPHTITGGYNTTTDKSSYTINITTDNEVSPFVYFDNTRATATSALNTGITNVKLMRPTTPTGPSYTSDVTFTKEFKDLIAKYSVMRFMGWMETNSNQTVEWSDRTMPNQQQARKFPITGTKYAGAAWEYAVLLANETGKDIWINIPAKASGKTDVNGNPDRTDSYIYQLANLIKNGSTVGGVTYPGLNPNLRVYVEYSNEVWNTNTSFSQHTENRAAAQAEVAAGNSPLNYDEPNPALAANGEYVNLDLFARRRVGQRLKDISDIFRTVCGEDQMFDCVRPVLAWFKDDIANSGSDPLKFLLDFYGVADHNNDGIPEVAVPRSPASYIYGGGGTSYFSSSNAQGDQVQGDPYYVAVGDASFEQVPVTTFQQNPQGSPWAFTGTAGIVHSNGGLSMPTAPAGTQAAYIEGNGAISQSFSFPAAGSYALYVQSLQVGGTSQELLLSLGTTPGTVSVRPSSSSFNGLNTYDVIVPAAQTAILKLSLANPAGAGRVFIDDVKVRSGNAIQAGMPTSGYQGILAKAANLASAFGLKYVTYEGGWSLAANDTGSATSTTPVQAGARDTAGATAATVNVFNLFSQIGGELFNDFGSGNIRLSPYARTNNISNLNTPLLQAVDQANDQLPLAPGAPPINSVSVPGTLWAKDATASYPSKSPSFGTVTLQTDESVSWNIWVTTAGNYTIYADTGAGGTGQLLVDGELVDTFQSGLSLARAPVTRHLDRGLHSLHVHSLSGTFAVSNVTALAGSGGSAPPALAVYDMAGLSAAAATDSPDWVAPTVTGGLLTRGPGLDPASGATFDNSFASIPHLSNRAWGTTIAEAKTLDHYVTFTLTPATGQKESLRELRFGAYGQSTTEPFLVELGYVDGAGYHPVTLNVDPATGYSAPLSGVAALQDATGPLTFRIYFAGPGAFKTVGVGRRPGTDLVVFASTQTTDPLPFRQAADGMISLEAEDYHVKQDVVGGDAWTPYTAAGFSGTGAMEATPNDGTVTGTDALASSPRLDFKVNFVTTGTHYIWVRSASASASDDSMHVGIDGVVPATSDRIQGGTGTWAWFNGTMDGPVATINVTATGLHTINVWMREDGFRLDKLVITPSSTFVPTGTGPAESSRGSGTVTVSGVSATSGRAYTLRSGLTSGDTVYTDRSYTYNTVPSVVQDAQFIQTANTDKTSTDPNLLSFTLSDFADVYVAYDSRGTTLPSWLSSWENTGSALTLSGGETMRLYRKRYGPGTVVLGGNLSGGAVGAATNYTVAIAAV